MVKPVGQISTSKPAAKIDKVKPVALVDSCLFGKTIMVNPGHGEYGWVKDEKKRGHVPGAHYQLNGKMIYEKDLNDSVATYLKQYLEQHGAKVDYQDNKPVTELIAHANKNKDDFYMYIHHDAKEKGSAKNFGETLFAIGTKNLKAAEAIDNKLKANLIIPNNPLDNKSKWAKQHIGVLRKVKKSHPSVLVEVGHMSNPTELPIIVTKEYQKMAAKNIADGIIDFFKSNSAKKEIKKKPIKK